MNAACEPMHQAAAGLGGRGIKQVSADRCRGMNAEQQDQERRHQRAAADTCHTNEEAESEAGGDIEWIDHAHEAIAYVYGYLRARALQPQCTMKNKNI